MGQTAISATQTRICVMADDLIWSSRLKAAVERAGCVAVAVKDAGAIDAAFAVIDLGGRAYDGISAVRAATSAGATVLAVAQHEDVELRKLALAAGATRVLSYKKMFSDGPDVIARLIEGKL